MRLRLAAILLIILASFVVGTCTPAAHAQRRAFIRVHVVDQNAHNYENVTVEVWRSALVDSGTTDIDGLWKTRVDGDGRVYDVRVFNGRRLDKNVQVIAADVFVEFVLERSAPAPLLAVSTVDYSPPQPAPGETVDARILITNIGSLNATDSALTLVALPHHVSLLETGSTFHLGPLSVGKTIEFTAKLQVDRSASTGPHLLQYQLSYTGETGYSYAYQGAFGILIGGFPEIEIHDVIVDPSTLNRKGDGTLTLELMNSGTEAAERVTVRVYDADMLTSTMGYVGRMDRGSVVNLVFGIHVDKNEDFGAHVLNMTITYVDQKGDSFLRSELYRLEIVQATPLLPVYDVFLGLLVGFFSTLVLFSFKRLGLRF